MPWDRGNPLFSLILLFSLDSLEFFEGSKDKAGLQAAVCEIQATQIAKMSCWFGGQKPGPSCNLWVTCSMFQHPIWKVAWAAKVGSIPESRLVGYQEQQEADLWATKSNTAIQQVEAKELPEEIAPAGSHPSHWGKPQSFERPRDALNLSAFPLRSFSQLSTNRT